MTSGIEILSRIYHGHLLHNSRMSPSMRWPCDLSGAETFSRPS